MTSLMTIILSLIILGLALFLVSLLPIDVRIKQAINAIAIVAVVVWCLQAFLGGGPIATPYLK
jgi:hypothetical protein